MKRIIISIKGTESNFGPITCCVIGVDTNCLRNFNIPLLIKTKSEKIFDIGDNTLLQNYYISKIDAKKIDNTTKQISELVFYSLNTIPNFWENEVFILSNIVSLKDIDFKTNLGKNLLKTKILIGEKSCNKDFIKLINYIHSEYYDKEIKLLRSVYGNTECIHTRKQEVKQ